MFIFRIWVTCQWVGYLCLNIERQYVGIPSAIHLCPQQLDECCSDFLFFKCSSALLLLSGVSTLPLIVHNIIYLNSLDKVNSLINVCLWNLMCRILPPVEFSVCFGPGGHHTLSRSAHVPACWRQAWHRGWQPSALFRLVCVAASRKRHFVSHSCQKALPSLSSSFMPSRIKIYSAAGHVWGRKPSVNGSLGCSTFCLWGGPGLLCSKPHALCLYCLLLN